MTESESGVELSESGTESSDETVSLPFGITLTDISCGICGEILGHPVTILCQHTFCYPCLQTMIQTNKSTTNKRECPMCRTAFILPLKNAKNYILDLLIGKLSNDTDRIKKSMKVTMRDEVVEELRAEFMPFFVNNSTVGNLAVCLRPVVHNPQQDIVQEARRIGDQLFTVLQSKKVKFVLFTCVSLFIVNMIYMGYNIVSMVF